MDHLLPCPRRILYVAPFLLACLPAAGRIGAQEPSADPPASPEVTAEAATEQAE